MTRDDDAQFLIGVRRRKRLRAARRHRRRRAGVVAGLIGGGFAVFAVAATLGSGVALSAGCSLDMLRQQEQIGENSFLFAADGSRLGSIPAERNREAIPLKRMGLWLPKATVAVEDRRFYQHGGVDYVGIARALWQDASAGKVVQGGSTITQQLVRNIYIGREQTVERKLKEACLAIKLSRRWSRDKILQEYLNTVYFGNHAYGAEAAAETYFSKHVRELNLRQAALIAGLPQAPSRFDPIHNPTGAVIRRNDVLRAMLDTGTITLAQYKWATRSNKLNLKPGSLYTQIREPYFFTYVIAELERVYDSDTVRRGGLRIYTTIDPKLQAAATRAIRGVLYEPDDPAAAIVSIQPGTGFIRAMMSVIPGREKNQFNIAAQSTRQSGSTFKSFVLASAIEQGIDPDSTYYPSAPFTCTTGPWCEGDYQAGKPWEVKTYDDSYIGWTSITNATLRSDNTVYAQLTLDVGPDNVHRMAKRLGVNLTQPPVASIGLGPLSVSPLDMAAAYATFASNGIYVEPTGITKVVLANGKTDKESGWGRPAKKRALSQGVAWKVTDILRQNAEWGTGSGSGDGIHPVAGKTGTTDDHADAWYIGFTRDFSTAVWMGYPGGEIPMESVHGQSVAGATFPVPIWHAYMEEAEAKRPPHDFLAPDEYPTYEPFTRGYFGYVYVYEPPAEETEAEPETTTTETYPKPTKPGKPRPTSEPKVGRPVKTPSRPKPPPPATKPLG